jgi:hypothetical protein
MTQPRQLRTATELAGFDVDARPMRREHAELYNRTVTYVRPWTDKERELIQARVSEAMSADPEATLEILDMLGLL